jgi:hypothetical protein
MDISSGKLGEYQKFLPQNDELWKAFRNFAANIHPHFAHIALSILHLV